MQILIAFYFLNFIEVQMILEIGLCLVCLGYILRRINFHLQILESNPEYAEKKDGRGYFTS